MKEMVPVFRDDAGQVYEVHGSIYHLEDPAEKAEKDPEKDRKEDLKRYAQGYIVESTFEDPDLARRVMKVTDDYIELMFSCLGVPENAQQIVETFAAGAIAMVTGVPEPPV